MIKNSSKNRAIESVRSTLTVFQVRFNMITIDIGLKALLLIKLILFEL